MRYILNSAVITGEGEYIYSILSLEEAIDWMFEGSFESAIGYDETAGALSELTGFDVPVNRRSVKMQTGDQALVFRLVNRVQDPAKKGQMALAGPCEWEIGLLRKVV